METKFHRQIPMEKKLASVMEVWSGKRKASEICEEMGISKEAYYQWERKAREGMEKALNQKPTGRPEKGRVPEEKLRTEVRRLREELEKRDARFRQAEKEKKTIEGELWMTRHVINYWTKHGLVDIKKNGLLGRILSRMFSRVAKKPLKTEESSKSSSEPSDSEGAGSSAGQPGNGPEEGSKT